MPKKMPDPALKAVRLYADIAKDTGVSQKDVAKVLASLRETTGRSLAQHGTAKVPGLCDFYVRLLPPRPAGMRKVFGKDVKLPSRGALKSLRVKASGLLRDLAVGV